MSGLTPEGFVSKRVPEIKLEREQGLLDRFGPVNLNSSSVFGQLIGLTTEREANLWAQLEEVYWSQYPRSATGINLDRMVNINGLQRLPARPTFVRGVVIGLPLTTLAVGRLVSSSISSEQYSTSSEVIISTTVSVGARISVFTVADNTDYTINLGGAAYTINSGALATEASILVMLSAIMPVGVTAIPTTGGVDNWLDLVYDTAQEIVVSANLGLVSVSNFANFVGTRVGPFGAAAHSLDTIVTPVAGWFSVDNRTPGTEGRYLESDEELRIRRANSLRLGGQGTLEAIISHLQQVPGVLSLRVAANNGTAVDAEGIPPQHIRAIVDGGVDEQIGRVLFNNVAGGIGYHGAVTVEVLSFVSNTYFPIKFDRPTNIPFYVSVIIQKSPMTPTDVIELVRTSLVEYAATLDISEPVIYTRLFTPINEVIGDGAYVSELYINIVPIDDPADQLTANIDPGPVGRMVLPPEQIQVFIL